MHTKYQPVQDSPLFWLRDSLVSPYSVTDFQGYTVNGGDYVTRLLFLGQHARTNTPVNTDDIRTLLRAIASSKQAWRDRIAVAQSLGVGIDAVFCPEGYPASYDEASKSLVTYVHGIESTNDWPNRVEFMNLFDVAVKIRELRDGRSFRQSKGLNSANTQFECALSRLTTDPWPGDLDGVLFVNGTPLALLEFKTHNLESPIENEHLGKYGAQDWRRIHVLRVFQKAMGDIPILFIVWGPNHQKIKIQKIENLDRTIDCYCRKDGIDLANTLVMLAESRGENGARS